LRETAVKVASRKSYLMTDENADVIAGPTGRRQRSDAEKARIAAESLAPDDVVSDVARRHWVTRWQVYDWRRRFRIGRTSLSEEIVSAPAFVRLAVDDGSQTGRTTDVIEIAIGDVVIRAGRDVDDRRVAGHVSVFPRARAEGSRQRGVKREGDAAGEANLPPCYARST
jgi:transposase